MKNILIIDDDEEMCSEISEILSTEGFSTNTANDGLKGLKLINEESYDLILLDLKIPGLSGFDILKNIKSKNNNIKVIVLTGRPNLQNFSRILTEEEVKEEGILKLSNNIVYKPFNINDLIEKVKLII